MRKNECKFCEMDMGCGEEIKNCGDRFIILHEPDEKKWKIAASGRGAFLIANIKYCPMCGRKLKGNKRK